MLTRVLEARNSGKRRKLPATWVAPARLRQLRRAQREHAEALRGRGSLLRPSRGGRVPLRAPPHHGAGPRVCLAQLQLRLFRRRGAAGERRRVCGGCAGGKAMVTRWGGVVGASLQRGTPGAARRRRRIGD